ncbi:MAG: DUF4065 domain-containing protein [Caldilineaceae bacterium]|nr:DUF4065 domain-containing protein [Caldilineaceae bacterium]
MSHDARAIANKLILMGLEDGNPLTPLQIIKLTYLCQAWMLGMFGEPMFEDEVEAWDYGPVIPEVYHGVKHFVNKPVIETMRARPTGLNDKEAHILNEVYRVYGSWSGGALSRHTHKPETPWYITKQENPSGRSVEIPVERIRKYYEDIIRAEEAAGTRLNAGL